MTTTPDPIEKAARAHWERCRERWPNQTGMQMLTWEQLLASFRAAEIEGASACISSLIPPSEEVVEAMFKHGCPRKWAEAAFTAAINHILAQGEKP